MTTNPKFARSAHRRLRFLPTPRDRRILEAVATHGRLTREHVRRLFFRGRSGRLASPQAVNARLLQLTRNGLLTPAIATTRHGSGPYAYAITPLGRSLLRFSGSSRSGATPGPVWHQLEIADYRVRLQRALEAHHGQLMEWQGEASLRALIGGGRRAPIPDALVHWHLRNVEGTFLLEWDRGTESLAILTTKLARYQAWFRTRGHRELLPGLGLRPRLAIVVPSSERAGRLLRWMGERGTWSTPSVFVGVTVRILERPLGRVWRVPASAEPVTLLA